MSGFLSLLLSHVLLWFPDLSQSGNTSCERSHTCITSCGKVAESSDDALRLPEAKVNATYLDALWIDEFQGLQSSQCSGNAFAWCVLCLLLGVSPWIVLVWGEESGIYTHHPQRCFENLDLARFYPHINTTQTHAF